MVIIKNTKSEFSEQVILFKLLELESIREFKYIHAHLNGVKMSIRQALKAKMSGAKRGHPDISWPLKRGSYSGLYIEMKFGKNKLTPEQIEYFDFVSEQGFKCLVCYSGREAFQKIKDYYSLA